LLILLVLQFLTLLLGVLFLLSLPLLAPLIPLVVLVLTVPLLGVLRLLSLRALRLLRIAVLRVYSELRVLLFAITTLAAMSVTAASALVVCAFRAEFLFFHNRSFIAILGITHTRLFLSVFRVFVRSHHEFPQAAPPRI